MMGVVAFPPSSSEEGFFFPKRSPDFAVFVFFMLVVLTRVSWILGVVQLAFPSG